MISGLKKIKSLHVLIFLMVILVATVVKFSPWENAGRSGKLIAWDVTSYYAYLPAQFIENDIELKFVEKDSSYYQKNFMYWPVTAPNGGKVIKTTMGLSFLYSPFFLIAKAFDDDNSINQGFSMTYEFWLVISCLFFTILGAIFLRHFLLLHYSDRVVSITLILIYLGTNLFYYITIEPLMPHAYNFFLMSLFILLTHKWHEQFSWIQTILLGFVFGLIVLIRPVNGIILLFFALYNVSSFSEIKGRMILFGKSIPKLLSIGAISFLVVLPQLIYWHNITGQYLFNSYVGEQFYLGNPHIIDGLFSYRKGWLLYTPIMIFGLIGLFLDNRNRISTLFVIAPTLYLIFSWWNWWYGGGFGCRPIIDFYPVLAIGLAATISKLAHLDKLKYGLIFFPLLMAFNLFQTMQKKSDAIHWDSMTKEAYWHNFLKRNPQPGLEDKLKSPNTKAAINGKDEY